MWSHPKSLLIAPCCLPLRIANSTVRVKPTSRRVQNWADRLQIDESSFPDGPLPTSILDSGIPLDPAEQPD